MRLLTEGNIVDVFFFSLYDRLAINTYTSKTFKICQLLSVFSDHIDSTGTCAVSLSDVQVSPRLQVVSFTCTLLLS